MNKKLLTEYELKDAVPDCSGCEACASSCPRNAIQMSSDKWGFRYPLIDEAMCIGCQLCFKVCPVYNKTTKEELVKEPKTYAGWILDEEIRAASSSGGIFTALARAVLKNHGLVYGAMINKELCCSHVRIDSLAGLSVLRGSKYVQSHIDQAYILAKQDLVAGKQVLFVGTACQIGGLKAYLRKEYDNLLTCDVLCHGVPSAVFFNKYIAWIEKEHDSLVEEIRFRDKKYGWLRYSQNILFSNQQQLIIPFSENLFSKGFLSNICLREACYQCCYKTGKKFSDITLGDFWGVQVFYPELFDDKGTSIVFVHSQKGEDFLAREKNNLKLEPVSYDSAVAWNSAYYKSVEKHVQRDQFCQDLFVLDFPLLMQKYFPPEPFCRKCIGKGKRLLKKFRSIFYK